MAEEPKTMPTVKIREIMKRPVIGIERSATIDKVAKLMAKHNIGSVVIQDDNGKPIGIITERDLVTRVFTKKTPHDKIIADKVMSTPLASISADVGIEQAARKMSKMGVRRLGVVEQDKLVGIISSRDIVAVTPALVEVIQERAKVGMTPRQKRPLAGTCENCGQWSDVLKDKDGLLVCEDCIVELESVTSD